jgi:outer membrane immunogenic protein
MAKFRFAVAAITFTSALALVAASANAADAYRGGVGGSKDGPAYATVAWTGYYAGVNLGYGEATNDNSDFLDNGGFLSPSGAFVGGQIGYNWQGVLGLGPNVVLGIEADLQGARA